MVDIVDQCPVYTVDDKSFVDSVDFWVGGLMTCLIGTFGFVINSVVVHKLRNKLMQNFVLKTLVMGLGVAQNLHLLSMITDYFGNVSIPSVLTVFYH